MDWKRLATKLQQLSLLLVAPILMAAQCDDQSTLDGVSAETGDPLIQESVVIVEVDVPSFGWVPMIVPQKGIESFARQWCWDDRRMEPGGSDESLCNTTVVTGQDPLFDEYDTGLLDGATIAECQPALCLARNEICAAMMLEEAARSPVPREYTPPDGESQFHLENLLLIPSIVRETALTAAGAPNPDMVLTSKIRFQPMQAPGRAATLRGALNRYRAAGVITTAMQDPWVADPVNGNGNDPCVDIFAELVEPTPFDPAPGDIRPSWNDVYYTAFLDASNGFSDALERTLAAMRDSAQSQISGNHQAQDEVATLWNGKVDSALAMAKLVVWGESDAPGGFQWSSFNPVAEAEYSASKIGPSGVPVCPPMSNDSGAQKVFYKAMSMGFKSPSIDIVASMAALESAQIGQTITGDQLKKALGASDKDFAKAALHQWKQAELTGTYMLEKQTYSNGSKSYYGVQKPQGTLPKAVLASHFSGVAAGNTAGKMGAAAASSYAKQGAARTFDLFKKTAKNLSNKSGGAGVNPALGASIDDNYEKLAVEAGKRRLEFHVGNEHPQDAAAVENLRITIHGVPELGTSGNPAEQYYVIQGTKGIKCVTTGTIDGAPCEASHYVFDVNASGTYEDDAYDPQSPVDARMTDLEGGFLWVDLTTLPEPGNATANIQQDHAVYVLRKGVNELVPFGGIVPAVGGVVLTDPTPAEATWPTWDVTRQVIAPAGGNFEDAVASALTPNSEDCSKLQATCGDVPADIWPPLESEIVGDGGVSSAPFEQSWRYWLGLAKDAAFEADRLGEELIEQGLKMDDEMNEAEALLEDACGVDAEPTSCGVDPSTGQPAVPVYATLGDRDVCLWSVNGIACERTVNNVPYALPCPVPVPDGEVATNCTDIVADEFTNRALSTTGLTAEPVTNKLKLVSSSGNPGQTGCWPFAALRKNAHAELPTTGPALDQQQARSDFIRTHIMNGGFGPDFMAEVARSLSYEEEFADHYVLRYGKDTIIFDTRRPSPHASNDQVVAPCKPNAADTGTGSEFWSRSLDCFVQPNPPSGDTPEQCDASGTVGHESCDTQQVLSKNDISHDTEHNALRRRWAWGFGHLRRSMAVLGAITGQLDGNMKLARVFPVAYHSGQPGFDSLGENTNAGRPCGKDDNENESQWLLHCTPAGHEEFWPFARCVPVRDEVAYPGVGSDTLREFTGRPVNVNGFIPNALAWGQTDDYFDAQWAGYKTTNEWPILCINGACAFAADPSDPFGAGGDPQMPYCSLPDPDDIPSSLTGLSAAYIWNDIVEPSQTSWNHGEVSNAFVGASMAKPAAVRSLEQNIAWNVGIGQIWQDPPGNFCAPPPPAGGLGAAWRALCFSPEGTSVAHDPNSSSTWTDQQFMRYARVSNKGEVLVTSDEVRKWLSPLKKSDKSRYGQMLFDLTKGNVIAGSAPFQYELNQRNVFDALELACHASTRAKNGAPVDCTAGIDPNTIGNDGLGKIASALECLGKQVGGVAERFVLKVQPLLLEKIQKGESLQSAGGPGGEYLGKLNEQYAALKRVGAGYAKIRDAQTQLAIALRNMDQIQAEDDALKAASEAQAIATFFQGVAAALSTVAGAGSDPSAAGAAMGSAAAQMIATSAQIVAIGYQNQAQNAELNQKRLDQLSRMVAELGGAREAADDVVLALNDLNKATADLELIQKKALKAVAAKNWSDYVTLADGTKDPQYWHVAMRRIFNTRLIRYERAFTRAKNLAYLARRAVELRFGVELERMTEPMTLVEPPNEWANDVCNMQGIDYSKIREPNPDAPVEGYTIGQTPIPGDDFANQYIGDYVKKLEDFVSSYPIDFPLKDGDDTAVISLADDIFRVSAQCTRPGRNLLYYSTDFGNNDSVELTPETHGWFVDGCGYYLPPPDGGPDGGVGAPWNGCVAIAADSAGPPLLADGGVPEGGTYGVTNLGLPSGAVPYRVRNEPCVSGTDQDGDPIPCPDESPFLARGSVRQWMVGMEPGYHVASVYALEDPSAVYASGDKAILQVVRDDDPNGGSGDTVVATVALDPLEPDEWTRFEIAFEADGIHAYRLELLPSEDEAELDLPGDAGTVTWPSLYLAAAQVERVGQTAAGAPADATPWVRTDASRDTIDPLCNELKGPELRKRFTRRCQYVCADGIKDDCGIAESNGQPSRCFYETHFTVSLEQIESGQLIPSGQIAIGNFNFRQNLAGINAVGTGLASCEGQPSSCYYNGFLEYTLVHSGNTHIRNYTGWNMPVKLDRAFVEHGKLLAAERVITNPPSSTDLGLLEPYMKHELKGRPMQGLFTLRIWEKPGLRWEQLEDLQLIWKYHYWTRFEKASKE